MYQTIELTLPEYEKALKKAKKSDVVSIALHHIKRVRELEATQLAVTLMERIDKFDKEHPNDSWSSIMSIILNEWHGQKEKKCLNQEIK